MSTAGAGVLERVRESRLLRCGAAAEPGFVWLGPDGAVAGNGVELCRAAARRLIGPGASIQFAILESAGELERARTGGADILFLTEEAIAAYGPTPGIVRGPVVFADPIAVMVPRSAPVQALSDLAGASICFTIGAPAHQALERSVARARIEIVRMAFEETVEMRDAYAVGHCQAMVGTAAELAPFLSDLGVLRLASRLLIVPAARVPVYAATATGDRAWSGQIFRLLRAQARATAQRRRFDPAG
jgi:general L-amino acid transport system substrate-binding protein